MTKRLTHTMLIWTFCLALNGVAADGKVLFILGGQSNMQGMKEQQTFVPRVHKEYGPEGVLVVKEAIGGQPIRKWVHDWKAAPGWKVDPDIPNTKPPLPEENGVMYNSMMQKIAQATQGESPKAIAFCWMQGERDARELHSAVYEQSLRQIFRQLEKDFPKIPKAFVIGRLSDFGKGNKEPFYPEWDEIRQAQEKIARDLPNCALIDTDDLNTGDSPPSWRDGKVTHHEDDLHMSAEGYRIMGTRFAEASIQLLAEVLPSQKKESVGEENDGTAPEVTDLNAKDVSFAKERNLPYLDQPYISTAPRNQKDGIAVAKPDAATAKALRAFAKAIAEGEQDKIDSLLVAHNGKPQFESYYRRGRANYPHYQMSITKSYTAMGIGRAIQLGHLTMEDLGRPVVDFLKEIERSKLVDGAENITLAEALNMKSGIRVDKGKVRTLLQNAGQLKGQGQIEAYMTHSAPVPDAPREYKYQASDPCMAMQVLEVVVPGTAEAFLRTEVLGRMGITNYHWDEDLSGLPKSAAGSSMRSRDMLKWGLLVMNDGKWGGEQLIPAEFVKLATSPLNVNSFSSYGFFWWCEDMEIAGRSYHIKSGRGAGGQFIMMVPELDLVIVVTAHIKGMGGMRHAAPEHIIPLYAGSQGT